ncbi:hypothetical protein JCM10908_006174 [Rhodotorula pacifica]|uniref:uncharacterized protein n=1 Tax=Rhodotorula pacifica TaxID=1495444 RepID=UPI00317DA124
MSIRTIARAMPRQASALSSMQPHLLLRIAPIRSSSAALSTSTRLYSSGEGMGESKPVGGDNPLSARASGVKKAAKSVAEGVEGIAQKATGDEQSNLGREEKHPGPDPRNLHEIEQDKGRKEGLAHKGEQQGAV